MTAPGQWALSAVANRKEEPASLSENAQCRKPNVTASVGKDVSNMVEFNLTLLKIADSS